MIQHPWVWLNEPQHSAAVQAVTGAIYTIAAIVAGYYAFGAFQAAKTQATAAREQLVLAHEQAVLAREVATLEKLRYEAEKLATEQAKQRAYELRAAEEDATRPVFRTGGYTNAREYRITFINHGATGATDVRVHAFGNNVIARADFVRAAGGEIAAAVNMESLSEEGYVLSFTSAQGSRWRVRVYGGNTTRTILEEVLSVDRPYRLEEAARA